jgi:hypothetical protein
VLEGSVGVDVAAVAPPPAVPLVPLGEPDVPEVPLVPLEPVTDTVPANACVVASAKITGLVHRSAALTASLKVVLETDARPRSLDWLPMMQSPFIVFSSTLSSCSCFNANDGAPIESSPIGQR